MASDSDLWAGTGDERGTFAVAVAWVVGRHGYHAPVGVALAELTMGLHRALHGCPLLPH